MFSKAGTGESGKVLIESSIIQNNSESLLNGQRVGGLTVYCKIPSPPGIILHAFIVYLSLKTRVMDIEWSESRRVNYHNFLFVCFSGIIHNSEI